MFCCTESVLKIMAHTSGHLGSADLTSDTMSMHCIIARFSDSSAFNGKITNRTCRAFRRRAEVILSFGAKNIVVNTLPWKSKTKQDTYLTEWTKFPIQENQLIPQWFLANTLTLETIVVERSLQYFVVVFCYLLLAESALWRKLLGEISGTKHMSIPERDRRILCQRCVCTETVGISSRQCAKNNPTAYLCKQNIGHNHHVYDGHSKVVLNPPLH